MLPNRLLVMNTAAQPASRSCLSLSVPRFRSSTSTSAIPDRTDLSSRRQLSRTTNMTTPPICREETAQRMCTKAALGSPTASQESAPAGARRSRRWRDRIHHGLNLPPAPALGWVQESVLPGQNGLLSWSESFVTRWATLSSPAGSLAPAA